MAQLRAYLTEIPALTMTFGVCEVATGEPIASAIRRADAALYRGKLAGRHKIAPRLSPSKTVEGFLGGCLSATAIGMALKFMTPFTLWQAALMGLCVTMMGFLGGLVMSAIKRDRGVKDWGHTIAGHGGFIDRLDSVLFAAPIYFHLLRYFWSV